ncbi:protein-glutamate O-methyltransferase CheR [Ideonella sp. B7]|uniref:CheR family methyltransferase n=1 Tax=Ideonella benzenivorans TaxID=2831643 RepID=UPI001CED9321|nr:protein-glutamate O-methyltransferase CheR [Ideonella benzenivorans]MCA6215659.1 protein-glutamate O-methyltransferase CheR [Ideonella benzenivorans]
MTGARMPALVLDEADFCLCRDWLRAAAGVELPPSRKPFVAGRLARRVAELGLAGFGPYLHRLREDPAEHARALDLLLSHETRFFRDPGPLLWLRDRLRARVVRAAPARVWSAGCSTGQEAYSIAMVLDDALGPAGWEVLGSDLSLRVLQRAREAAYDLPACSELPPAWFQRYARIGHGEQAGRFRMVPTLVSRVRFEPLNLIGPWPALGRFDAIFLCNVLCHLTADVRRSLVPRLLGCLGPGGALVLGAAETLPEPLPPLMRAVPSVYVLRPGG